MRLKGLFVRLEYYLDRIQSIIILRYYKIHNFDWLIISCLIDADQSILRMLTMLENIPETKSEANQVEADSISEPELEPEIVSEANK